MADDSAPRSGIRVLDLSTPRPPGEAPPEPSPEALAAPVPRGPAPVVGKAVDLSTGKPPSRAKSSRTNNPEGLRVVVQQTINLSTPRSAKPAEAQDDGQPRSRRGTRPEGAPRSRDGQGGGQDTRRKSGGPKGGGAKGNRRGGPKSGGRPHGGRPHGGGSRDGGPPSGQAPRSASTGLADFLDPETLKRLRGE